MRTNNVFDKCKEICKFVFESPFATKIYDFAILQSDWSILKAQLLSLKEEKISFEQVNKLKFIIYMPPPVFNIFMDKKSFCS